jgi:ABC-type transport system involved in multi-copper enzyme maturation permease subunit
MLRRVLTIALNTYRESVRARILIGLAGIAFAAAFYSLIVGAYTLTNAPRVASNLGTATLSLFSVAVTVLIGATSLHRELEQKTIFPILARPISRTEYLAGKYFGTVLTLLTFVMADAGLVLFLGGGLGGRPIALVAGLGAALVAALVVAALKWPAARTYGPIPWAAAVLLVGVWLCGVAPDERRVVLGSAALTLIEVCVLTAIALLFSSFSTPFLSALLTLGVFVICRQTDLLPHIPVKQFGQAVHDGGVVMSKIIPNLHLYVPPRPLLTGEAADADLPKYFGMALLHGAAWSLGLFAAASFLFKRRDFL